MTRTSSAHAPEGRGFGTPAITWWPLSTASWMGVAFLVAFALAVIVLAIFGVGERGTAIALRATARWSFLLFWLAYAGGAIAWLFGPRLGGLARHGRDLGLAFASAQLVHVGLVLWIIHIATRPGGIMMFFWVGIFCTYLLALFSVPQLRNALDPRLWRMFRAIALEYIAIAFAADFILGPLQANGLEKFRLSYAPFALMLVIGAGLRCFAFLDRKLRSRDVSQFSGMAREIEQDRRPPRFDGGYVQNLLILWPALIFVGVIAVLLAFDDALWGFFQSALALYGPLVVVLGAYVLLKAAVRGTNLSKSQFK